MSPPVVLYVAITLGTVAGAAAFKEFIYEPHIAPKIERWAEDFVAKRQARRRERESQRDPIGVPSGGDDVSRGLGDGPDGSSLELENLGFNEMREHGGPSQAYLRRRTSSRLMDESDPHLAYEPMSPTHVIYDASSLSTSPTNSVRMTPSTARAPLQLGARTSATYPSPRPSPRASPIHSLNISLASPARAQAHPNFQVASPSSSSSSSLSLSPNIDAHLFSYPTSPFSDSAALHAPAGSSNGHTESASAHSDFTARGSPFSLHGEDSDGSFVGSGMSDADREDFDFGSASGLSDDESWASASVASRR